MWLQTLTDCNGNAQSPAAANRLISFSVFLFVFSPSLLSSPIFHPSPFFPSLSPFHVLHAPTFPQLEVAIENLQKSEGIAPHKSSLLNSHVSQTGKKLYWNWNKSWKKGLVLHPSCLFALLFTAAVSMLLPEGPLALCILGLECLRPPAFTWNHWTSQGSPCLYLWDVPLNSKHLNLYLRILYLYFNLKLPGSHI